MQIKNTLRYYEKRYLSSYTVRACYTLILSINYILARLDGVFIRIKNIFRYYEKIYFSLYTVRACYILFLFLLDVSCSLARRDGFLRDEKRIPVCNSTVNACQSIFSLFFLWLLACRDGIFTYKKNILYCLENVSTKKRSIVYRIPAVNARQPISIRLYKEVLACRDSILRDNKRLFVCNLTVNACHTPSLSLFSGVLACRDGIFTSWKRNSIYDSSATACQKVQTIDKWKSEQADEGGNMRTKYISSFADKLEYLLLNRKKKRNYYPF
jgi:hypothetical protein